METTQKQQLVEQVSEALKEQFQIVADRITGNALRACEEIPDCNLPGLDIVIKVRLERPEPTRAMVQVERVEFAVKHVWRDEDYDEQTIDLLQPSFEFN